MHVPANSLCPRLDVFLLKIDSGLVRVRYDEQVEVQRQYCDQCGGEYVRDHHSVETDSAGQDCDDLRIRGHLRGEENHRYEHEQRAEHVHEIWNEVHIIIEDYGLQRRFLADKIVDLLTDVEDYDDADDQQKSNEECRDELSYYI